MSRCIFPGSFDPMTLGHLDLIRRAAALFDEVTVTVMVNRSKSCCIPAEERVRMIREACRGIRNVSADFWQGLLADYVRMHPGAFVIRGIRTAAEFEQENASAAVNKLLYSGMETVFIPSSDEWSGVSSSAVREIASFGGDFRQFVPACNYAELLQWLKPAEK